jgi:hypothetical protein
MSPKETPESGVNPVPSVVGNDKLQFEEETTFSDPVPIKQSTVASSLESDEEGHDFNKNPFLDPDVAAHWTAVYEASQYECRHVFDPELTWTEEEEKKLVRRLDWRVCLWAVWYS